MHFKTECEIIDIGSLKELVEKYNLEVYDKNQWSYIYNGYPEGDARIPERIDLSVRMSNDDEYRLINTDYAQYYNLHLDTSGYTDNVLFRLPDGDLWYFSHITDPN